MSEPRGEWIACGACYFGTVSTYSAFDFEGPGDCRHCAGSGEVWRYPSGALALWPGGPFCGKDVPVKPAEPVR